MLSRAELRGRGREEQSNEEVAVTVPAPETSAWSRSCAREEGGRGGGRRKPYKPASSSSFLCAGAERAVLGACSVNGQRQEEGSRVVLIARRNELAPHPAFSPRMHGCSPLALSFLEYCAYSWLRQYYVLCGFEQVTVPHCASVSPTSKKCARLYVCWLRE